MYRYDEFDHGFVAARVAEFRDRWSGGWLAKSPRTSSGRSAS